MGSVQSSPLLELPLELRNIIYRYTLADRALPVLPHGKDWKRGQPIEEFSILPISCAEMGCAPNTSLLRVNKQIAAELAAVAEEEMTLRVAYVASGPDHFSIELASIPLRVLVPFSECSDLPPPILASLRSIELVVVNEMPTEVYHLHYGKIGGAAEAVADLPSLRKLHLGIIVDLEKASFSGREDEVDDDGQLIRFPGAADYFAPITALPATVTISHNLFVACIQFQFSFKGNCKYYDIDVEDDDEPLRWPECLVDKPDYNAEEHNRIIFRATPAAELEGSLRGYHLEVVKVVGGMQAIEEEATRRKNWRTIMSAEDECVPPPGFCYDCNVQSDSSACCHTTHLCGGNGKQWRRTLEENEHPRYYGPPRVDKVFRVQQGFYDEPA